MANWEPRLFRVAFGTRALVGDLFSREEPIRLLVLHGAGHSQRARFRELRQEFWSRGISSAAFDFVGHGDTGGSLGESSLKERTEQACQVIESLNLATPFSILAASMGAYTAVRLLEHHPVERMVLLVPAMYTAAAYDVPFQGGFTPIIRRSRSWEDSDAWEILSRYRGSLMTVAAENDPVIPREVVERIHRSAVQARERELHVVPRASHNVLTDLRAEDPPHFRRLLDGLVRFLDPNR
jgi:pimeloyl-ACP methyl ester carboxylesterase